MEVELSDDEKLFLISGVESDIRNDGRTYQDFRQIILERGVLASTNGSCRVQIGSTTDVLAGLKLELETYDPATEQEVKQPMQFCVDFSANASVQFAGKGGDEYAEELAAAFQTAYSKSLDILPDLPKTQLAEGYRWKIYVDVSVLQWDGSVADAISLAIIGSLSDMDIPEVEVAPDDGGKKSIVLKRPKKGGNVRDEEVPVAMWNLDVLRCPLLLTVSKIGTANVMDCTPEEEICVRSQVLFGLTPSVDSRGEVIDTFEVVCMKQMGGGLLEVESVEDMLQVAKTAAKGLRDALQKRIKEEEPRKPGYSFLL